MDPPNVIYKNKCCVPGCTNRAEKRHRFPKDVSLLHAWVDNIKNPLLRSLEPHQIYRCYYVCDKHFAQEYIVSGTRRGLRRDAIPTLQLPVISEEEALVELTTAMVSSSEEHLVENPNDNTLCEHAYTHISAKVQTASSSAASKTISEEEDLVMVSSSEENLLENSKENVYGYTQHATSISGELPTASLFVTNKTESQTACPPACVKVKGIRKRRGILQAVDVTRQQQLTPRCKKFYKLVGEWGSRTAKLQYKLSSLRKRLQNAERVVKCPNFSNLLDAVNETTYRFIMQQVRTQHLAPKARRFTLDEKILSLTLLKASAKGYRLLSKIFCLPSQRTLTNMLNKIPYRPGINKHIFSSLKLAVANLPANDKLCAVVFDKMAISSLLQYNIKDDCVEGVTDFGTHRSPHLADHANVFMIKGINRQWKQALSFTFSSGPVKSAQLKTMIVDVVKECQQIGVEVVVTICDQGSANQAAINTLLKETNENCIRAGVSNIYHGFLVNNKEVVPLYDVPHLFKGLRNNLLLKNLHFMINGVSKVAQWSHIESLYFLDTADDTRLLPKLTDRHVIPNKINKMKVACMTQVFSYAVGAHLKRFAGWSTHTEYSLPAEAAQTGEFILFIDQMFDSLNANNKIAASSKPLKGGVTSMSEHETFWRESIKIIQSMQFFDARKKKLSKVPSIINLIKTLKGFIYLKRTLLSKMQYFLPRAFNQDCLENFFASMRGHGRRHIIPDALHFISSFKALIVNNFLSNHSPGANCETDFSMGALDNLRMFVTGEEIAGVSPLEANLPLNTPLTIFHAKTTPIAKATLAYVAGFIGKRMLRRTCCDTCKRLLTASYGNVPMDVIEAREYKHCRLFRPGTYLYFVTSQACSQLFYLIPRYCHKFGIGHELVQFIMKSLNPTFFNCKEHVNLGLLIVKLLAKTILYFWCKQVNKVLNGTDESFVKFVASKRDVAFVDPIKLEARRKYMLKLKNKKEVDT